MGLFDKKFCDICGEKIGLLGNRKLEDGNLCKDCAKKLSPFFDERRHSTIEDIKKQLEYREQNKSAVASFRTTNTFECAYGYKLHFDNTAGTFMLQQTSDLVKENPDVVSLSAVTGCFLDIDERKTEIMRENSDGTKVSYTPKRYSYEYDFYIRVTVNHPYFDEIKIKINRSTVDGESRAAYENYRTSGEQIRAAFLGSAYTPGQTFAQPAGFGQQAYPQQNGFVSPQGFPQQNGYASQQGYPQQNVGFVPPQGFPQQNGYAPQQGYTQQNVGFVPPLGFPQQNGFAPQQGYPQQNGFAQQQPYQQANAYAAQQQYAQPVQNAAPSFCPNCGAQMTPDASGKCPYCGGQVI